LRGYLSLPLFLFSLSLEGRGHMGEGEEFLTATPTFILPPQGGGEHWRVSSHQGGEEQRKHPHLHPPPSRGRRLLESILTSRGRRALEKILTSRGRRALESILTSRGRSVKEHNHPILKR